jgi:hypothetical protein
MKRIVLAASCAVLLVGCHGGVESICDQAADHVAACGVTNLPHTGECNAAQQELAARVLELDCADMAQRESFTGASCDSIWALFKPSCWWSSSHHESPILPGGLRVDQVLASPSAGFHEPTAAALVKLTKAVARSADDADAMASDLGLVRLQRFKADGLRADVYSVPGTNPPVDVISFRGTNLTNIPDAIKNLCTDLDAVPTSAEILGGNVHRGFQKGLTALWDSGLGSFVKERPGARFWLTGHSLGSALATLAAPRVMEAHQNGSVIAIYTFGSPRVGNVTFRDAYNAQFGTRHFRVTYTADPIAHVPPARHYEYEALGLKWLSVVNTGYAHAGSFCWYREGGVLHNGQCTAPGSDAGYLEGSWRSALEALIQGNLFSDISRWSSLHSYYSKLWL